MKCNIPFIISCLMLGVSLAQHAHASSCEGPVTRYLFERKVNRELVILTEKGPVTKRTLELRIGSIVAGKTLQQLKEIPLANAQDLSMLETGEVAFKNGGSLVVPMSKNLFKLNDKNRGAPLLLMTPAGKLEVLLLKPTYSKEELLKAKALQVLPEECR